MAIPSTVRVNRSQPATLPYWLRLALVFTATVLARLSPFVSGPGGGWLGAAGIFVLSQCQLTTDRLRHRLLLLAGWLAVH